MSPHYRLTYLYNTASVCSCRLQSNLRGILDKLTSNQITVFLKLGKMKWSYGTKFFKTSYQNVWFLRYFPRQMGLSVVTIVFCVLLMSADHSSWNVLCSCPVSLLCAVFLLPSGGNHEIAALAGMSLDILHTLLSLSLEIMSLQDMFSEPSLMWCFQLVFSDLLYVSAQ